MLAGIYFNKNLNEVHSVGLGQDEEPLTDSDWVRVSDDPRLGLLAIRRLLTEQGLVADPRGVDWLGTRAGGPGAAA